MRVPINSGNRSGSCSENCGSRIAQVVGCHSENGISYSENRFLNSKSCSKNTPELSKSSENGLFTPRAFFLALPYPSFPCFSRIPCFFLCEEFLVFSSVFFFFCRDFEGSVGINNPCFFGGFPCLFPKKQGKEGRGGVAPRLLRSCPFKSNASGGGFVFASLHEEIRGRGSCKPQGCKAPSRTVVGSCFAPPSCRTYSVGQAILRFCLV